MSASLVTTATKYEICATTGATTAYLARVCLYLMVIGAGLLSLSSPLVHAQTAKPMLHGKHWIAITGKPLGATAGARMFHEGGNAVDAACAMLAAEAWVQ